MDEWIVYLWAEDVGSVVFTFDGQGTRSLTILPKIYVKRTLTGS